MRAASTFLLAALLVSAGCDNEGSSAAAGQTAESSVIATVDGVAITREDLKQGVRFSSHITLPDATERFLQRVALRDLLLPRAAIASLNPEGRAAALARAESLRATLLDGMAAPEEAGELVESGDFQTFGAFVLGAALDLEPGEWSDPIEGLGLYHLVRLIELPVEGSAPLITLGVINFPYEELTQTPEEILTQTQLEIVDPALTEIIPAALRYSMRGDASAQATTD